MPLLRVKQTWKRQKPPKPERATERADKLTPEEQAHVVAALKVLRVRFGSWEAVAEAMGVAKQGVYKVARRHRQPTAGLAIRAAKAAAVPVDDVLSGAFPRPDACPFCGRDDAQNN